jgi:hypothetical protein
MTVVPGSAPDRRPPSLVIVIGTNRSGTTWLNQLLQAHREVSGIDQGETTLFQSLAGLWSQATRASAAGSSPPAPAAAVRAFCDDLAATARCRSSRPSARYFVEKTPGTAVALPMLRQVYPDAWYIHIFRDGRDVVRSMRRRHGYATKSDFVNSYYWAQHERCAGTQLRDFDRVITVRYEDLHDDPIKEILAVYDRLGLDRYTGLVREIGRRCGQPVARFTQESSVGSGKWRRDVSRRRLALMYAGAGEQLHRYGYLDAAEFARWRRRPEYLVAVARRWLIKRGAASRGATRVFGIAGQMHSDSERG